MGTSPDVLIALVWRAVMRGVKLWLISLHMLGGVQLTRAASWWQGLRQLVSRSGVAQAAAISHPAHVQPRQQA